MKEIKQNIINIVELIASYKNIKRLTYEIADNLIDKIFVKSKENIKVTFCRIVVHPVKIGIIDFAAFGE